MKYLKETLVIMITAVALFTAAAFIAAHYTVRVILDPKKKW